MRRSHILASLAAALVVMGSAHAQPAPAPSPVTTPVPNADGVIQLHSANDFDTTLARLKADVAAKGIRFFDAIDQTGLGDGAGLKIRRSTLVLFGNPPLGVQFLQANPYAGLDWPVRMLVLEDAQGDVWLAWTDFNHIARRYRITNRDAQFKMASEVAASIAAAAATR
ncbi:DUF302 domain-containing protein [Sandarakinorhabdus rubra]|uniref:DUF302 domain-containing protein n=1 Tax=Sandarakinorhabdus rubra TaxID=2672568 RepID=UPI0013DA5A4A|nr:DUF302 domain-containing protein [Sandarakinorhabdus rubra]